MRENQYKGCFSWVFKSSFKITEKIANLAEEKPPFMLHTSRQTLNVEISKKWDFQGQKKIKISNLGAHPPNYGNIIVQDILI